MEKGKSFGISVLFFLSLSPCTVSLLLPSACMLLLQLCLILCDSIDCSLPGSSAYGILQERILEWVVMPFSWGSSWQKDQTWVACIAADCFTKSLNYQGSPLKKYTKITGKIMVTNLNMHFHSNTWPHTDSITQSKLLGLQLGKRKSKLIQPCLA